MIETRPPTRWLLPVLWLGCLHASAEAQVRPAPEPPKPQALVEAIVYTTLPPPNLDLYLFEEPGGDARRLTDDPAKDYNAVFSPDGRWIVFTSERAGPADLYALALESEDPPLPLTRHAALDDAAAFSPDGRRLAFVSTRDGDADIFVMPFAPGDTSAEKQAVNLTQRPGGDFNPAFSPDGRRIAYSRQDELWSRLTTENPRLASAAADLYVMNADGSNTRRVSEAGPGLDLGGVEFGRVNGSPAWSPDGSALIYYRLGSDGAEIRRVALDASGDASSDVRVAPAGLSPAVTPDGRVAFSRPQPSPETDAFDALKSGRVFSVAADGSDLRAESDAERSCFAPEFDRGTSRMVCHGPGPVDGPGELSIPALGNGFLFSPPGARNRVELPDRTLEVIGVRGFFPALLPSGEVVYTLIYRGGPSVPLEISAIDGSGARSLFAPASGIAWGAAVARDAGWLVTAVGPPFAPGEASVDLWKVPLDGSDAVNLTAESTGNDALPHVSPDGRRIVFRSGGDGSGWVYVMNPEGGERRRLTDDSATETMPALSPDGEQVVFPTRRAGGFKLWIQKVDGSAGRFLEPDRLGIPDQSLHPRFSPDGRWVVFTSDRSGFNDEWPLTWSPQPYGELWAVPVSGGPAVRLTHDKWEDGPNDWGYARLAAPPEPQAVP